MDLKPKPRDVYFGERIFDQARQKRFLNRPLWLEPDLMMNDYPIYQRVIDDICNNTRYLYHLYWKQHEGVWAAERYVQHPMGNVSRFSFNPYVSVVEASAKTARTALRILHNKIHQQDKVRLLKLLSGTD